MAFKRGRTSKHKSRPDAGSRKSKTEDPEEDSQQEDADKEEHNDSNDTVNTQFKLNRQSILELFLNSARNTKQNAVSNRQRSFRYCWTCSMIRS